METLLSFFQENILNNKPLISGIIFLSFGSFFIYFFIRYYGKDFYSILGNRALKQKLLAQLPKNLQSYHKGLEVETLEKGHDWLGDKRTIQKILVPVNILPYKSPSLKFLLQDFLKQTFSNHQVPRLIIIGEAGSGKSIAMKVAIKNIWNLNSDFENPSKIPIFLTFSDIKNLTRDSEEKEFEKKIVASLRKFQFQEDEKTTLLFVNENLKEGNLVLIIDGYDELEKSTRREVTLFLTRYLKTNNKVPVLISSRTAVYESELPFKSLKPQLVRIAPFTPFAIRQFLTGWQFEKKKNASELFEMIHGRAHLAELAQNPLMLTLIAFLYSKQKYTLPDNRVEFYKLCTNALLDEWDIANDSERENKFKSDVKIKILSHLAYIHIRENNSTDQDIPNQLVQSITKEELKNSGLKEHLDSEMIDEIVKNSNLLLALPPNAYRFPHRTFMEYFAARFINQAKDVQYLLNLFKTDPAKWKETLLLYCGLNMKDENSISILEFLIEKFKENPDDPNSIILFSALMESNITQPDLANEILDLAEDYLINNQLNSAIIEDLGFIATDENMRHATKAKGILINLLTKDIEIEDKQNILFALMRIKEDDIVNQVILENLKDIDLQKFFAQLTGDRRYFIQKIIDLYPTTDKQIKIIKGLKDAVQFELLGELLIHHKDEKIKQFSAQTLAEMSRLEGFFDFLDTARFDLLQPELRKIIEEKFIDWGWRWENPTTDSGKKMAILICYLVSQSKELLENLTGESSNRFVYLSNSFRNEQYKDVKNLSFAFENYDFKIYNFTSGLKKHWKKKIHPENLLTKFVNWINNNELIFVSVLLLILVLSISPILFMFFYKSFFEIWGGLSYLVMLIFFYLSAFILDKNSSPSKSDRNTFLLNIGIVFFLGYFVSCILFFRGRNKSDKIISIISILSPILLIISPFNFYGKLAFSIYCLICLLHAYDNGQINSFTIFNGKVKQVLDYLEYDKKPELSKEDSEDEIKIL